MLTASVVVFILSGCGRDTVIVDNSPIPETYFITDGFGLGVGGIIYHCDSGFAGVTNFEGTFIFDIVGDNCNFDFYTNDIIGDVYLEFSNNPNIDTGINGIYFECVANGFLSETGHTGDIVSNGFIVDSFFHDGCTLFDIH